MIPVWPQGFMQTPKKNTWTGSPLESRAVFQPEVGPPIYRARMTAEPWSFRGTFPLADEAERTAFWEFWAAIKCGTKEFLWRDPLAGDVRRWKFAGSEPVRQTDVTGLRSDIAISVIRLPGTPWWAALMPPGPLVAPRAAYDFGRGLFHDGLNQLGRASAVNIALPGLIRAHGLSDVRVVLGSGPVLTLRSQILAAGWWPAGQTLAAVDSITIFSPGALA